MCALLTAHSLDRKHLEFVCCQFAFVLHESCYHSPNPEALATTGHLFRCRLVLIFDTLMQQEFPKRWSEAKLVSFLVRGKDRQAYTESHAGIRKRTQLKATETARALILRLWS